MVAILAELHLTRIFLGTTLMTVRPGTIFVAVIQRKSVYFIGNEGKSTKDPYKILRDISGVYIVYRINPAKGNF